MVKLHLHPEMTEALLDSGASKRIINGAMLAAIVKPGLPCTHASPTILDTIPGSISSDGTVVTQFFFPNLKPDKLSRTSLRL